MGRDVAFAAEFQEASNLFSRVKLRRVSPIIQPTHDRIVEWPMLYKSWALNTSPDA